MPGTQTGHPPPAYRRHGFRIPGDRYRDKTMKGNFTDSRIVTLLAQTGQEDFNPGKGGRVARFGGERVQVAANETAHEKGPGTRTSRALLQWVSLESA